MGKIYDLNPAIADHLIVVGLDSKTSLKLYAWCKDKTKEGLNHWNLRQSCGRTTHVRLILSFNIVLTRVNNVAHLILVLLHRKVIYGLMMEEDSLLRVKRPKAKIEVVVRLLKLVHFQVL